MSTDFSNYFASGSNHAGEIAGLVAIGRNVGVAAPEVNEEAIRELEAAAGTGVKVFVDSGAFAEVSFVGGFSIKKEITDDEWLRRLGLYERLARVLGSQLYCVAPDMVGQQAVTADRLTRYGHIVRRIRRLGANIIVPVQKGTVYSMAQFDELVGQILGFNDYVRGVPLKKDATSHQELVEFAASLPAGTEVHLLGKGPYSRDYDRCMAAVAHCRVTCDSVRIRALVGRKPRPRALTAAQDAIMADLLAAGREATTYLVKKLAIIRVLGAEVGADVAAAEEAARKAA